VGLMTSLGERACCRRVLSVLDFYLNGELRASAMAAARAHLAACARCAAILDERRRLARGVRAAATVGVPVPERLRARVRFRLQTLSALQD